MTIEPHTKTPIQINISNDMNLLLKDDELIKSSSYLDHMLHTKMKYQQKQLSLLFTFKQLKR